MNRKELNKIFDNGKYAWPGGYEIVFLMDDGETVCFDCAVDNRSQIEDALTAGYRDGWKPEGITSTEYMDLSPGEAELCAHCHRIIFEVEEEVCC